MAISVAIPGRDLLVLERLVLDLNGTLTNRGELIDGVAERLERLSKEVEIELMSADTFGVLDDVADALGAHARVVSCGSSEPTVAPRSGTARTTRRCSTSPASGSPSSGRRGRQARR